MLGNRTVLSHVLDWRQEPSQREEEVVVLLLEERHHRMLGLEAHLGWHQHLEEVH